MTCPAGITIECSDDFTPGGAGYATSTDNCDPDPTETFTDATLRAIVRITTRSSGHGKPLTVAET
ncbi:MAG: hypothetical protein IPJ06_05195 [Saprospiraceae bacterium]|nr:hypothetical protein [Saprospiraceae bacterium]